MITALNRLKATAAATLEPWQQEFCDWLQKQTVYYLPPNRAGKAVKATADFDISGGPDKRILRVKMSSSFSVTPKMAKDLATMNLIVMTGAALGGIVLTVVPLTDKSLKE